ncbi:MAG: adenylate/guanylate cyclase domain-containing protein [Gemmatimonadales bacterium]
MRKQRRLVALALCVAAAVLLALALDAAGGLTGLRAFEDFTLDLRQQTTPESFQPGRAARPSDVVLVLFDEYSVMDSLDGWDWISPFPRAHLADLVESLSAAGARTIGLDVYLDRLYSGLNAIDQGDERLREAIRAAGNVILATPVVQTDSGPVMSPPHRYFAEVAAGVGSAELPSSFESFRDGTLAVRSGFGIEPSFALALYAHARGLAVDSILRAAIDAGRLTLPGLPSSVGRIPPEWLDADDATEGTIVPFRIRYVGPPSSADADAPPGTFQASASGTVADLGLLMPELFRNKVVLLGTGFHAEDRFRTPFYSYRSPDTGEPYGWMYGVEIHANMLQNMLDAEYVRPTGIAGELLLLLLAALVAGGATFWRGAGWGAVAAVLAAIGTIAYAWWAWAGTVYVPGAELLTLGERFRWIPVGAPIVSGMLAYVGSVAYVAVVEGRDKRRIKGAFAKYVSPDIVNEIAEDPAALRLGGQKKPLTILFSDLSGFTTLAENMDPENLLTLLNEYLDDMTQVVLDEGGTLDKYIGDAVMAFWNAPKAYPDHADRAMRAAVTMQRHMDALNRRWGGGAGGEELKVRIGIHTGEVVVGNLGGEGRFSYSAIGDAVNLAARLEPANKTYDTLNMVSQATLEAADASKVRVRELDYVAVKGKEEPVVVYELLEMAGVGLPEGKEEALRRYEEGMARYKHHDWAGAKAHFQAALAAWPSDGPSRVYAERCDAHIASPPPPDWDFVVRRQEK